MSPILLRTFCHSLPRLATRGQKVDEVALNFMVSVIKGLEPRDQLEAMLAAQMAAVHSLTMTFARRLNNVDNIPQQDSAERAFNKLARTFAAQVETLKRYRSNGEQKVTVEHVTVNDGGKAIVGNVTHGGRVSLKNGRRPHDHRLSIPRSPRCSATSKRTRKPCMAPAVNGWTVCRHHGARGGGPKGKRNGMYRHGLVHERGHRRAANASRASAAVSSRQWAFLESGRMTKQVPMKRGPLELKRVFGSEGL